MRFEQAENETGGELRSSDKTELSSMYALLVIQSHQLLERCVLEWKKI